MVQPRGARGSARARCHPVVGVAGSRGAHPAAPAGVGREHRDRRAGSRCGQARSRVRRLARRERADRRGDGRCLRAHRGSDRHRDRHRRGYRIPESEAHAGDLWRSGDARDDRERARTSRDVAPQGVRDGTSAVRPARGRSRRAPYAGRRASRLDGAARRMTLSASLEALDDAVDAAGALGLDTSRARRVLAHARPRLGFEGPAYVLAFVGGTGVGKSSLLNALAGEVVSPASARRPTTGTPIAWVAESAREETAPLLGWLDVREVRDHTSGAFADVAVLDLPDVDSTNPEHRARVDELLPRVDAVVWVADPEKYRDAVLHDDYLRRWAPRLARQLVVVNKADRMPDDVERVREHLASSLRDAGLNRIPVAVTSATHDGEVHELREWIAEGVEAKRMISARISTEVREAAADLAARAGVVEGAPVLVSAERRTRALADVTREAATVIDLRGLERQAVAATRLAARPRGAGPFGHLTALAYKASGRDRTAADPEGYLRRWRERGALARPAEPVRALIAELIANVPAETRGALASLI